MKRLVTSFAVVGLMLAVSSNMAFALVVEPYTYGSGTTAWVATPTPAPPAVGSSSLELNGYPADGIHYAGAKVTDLGDPTVTEFSGWDYWTRGPEFHGVNFDIGLDTSYDNPSWGYDVLLRVMPYNMMGDQTIPDDTWVQLDSSTPYPYQFFAWDSNGTYLGGYDISMWDSNPENMTTWSEFQGLAPITTTWGYTYDFSAAIIKMARMRMGGGGLVPPGGWGTSRGYLDDFTLDGVAVEVEGGFVPEPATIALLGLGALSLLRRRKA